MAQESRRTPLRMPKMSMTMETGELAGWRVGVGDVVREGDVVCDVLTDKVDMEVEAPAGGTVVELVAAEGDTVPVGEPLAWIETTSDSLLEDLLSDGGPPGGPEEDAATAPSAAPAPAPPAPAPVPAAAPAPAPSAAAPPRVPALPGARRLAAQSGLDLAAIAGSGSGGAVLVSDVRAALGSPAEPGEVAEAAEVVASAAPPQPVETAAAWAARAVALAPRADEASAGAAWRDVVLPGAPDRDPGEHVLARVVAGTAAALAALGPAGSRERPRVGVRVPTAAGPVTVTVADAHRLDGPGLHAVLGLGTTQAEQGRLDVAYLAPPDAVVAVVPDADGVLPPVPAPAALAIGVGAVTARVVPVGEGIGVRAVLSLGATGHGWAGDPAVLGRVLGAVAGALVDL